MGLKNLNEKTQRNANNMQNLRLYREFYKSTLLINWGASTALAILTMSPLAFPIVTMTGGTLISLFYKELTAKNEYYFYYNRGISKISLMLVSFSLNMLVGLMLIYIILKCQAF